MIFIGLGAITTPLINGWPMENPPEQRRLIQYILDTNSRIESIQKADRQFQLVLVQYKKGLITPVATQRELSAVLSTIRQILYDLDYQFVAQEFAVFHSRFRQSVSELANAVSESSLYFKDIDPEHLKLADRFHSNYKVLFKDSLELYHNLVKNESRVVE